MDHERDKAKVDSEDDDGECGQTTREVEDWDEVDYLYDWVTNASETDQDIQSRLDIAANPENVAQSDPLLSGTDSPQLGWEYCQSWEDSG